MNIIVSKDTIVYWESVGPMTYIGFRDELWWMVKQPLVLGSWGVWYGVKPHEDRDIIWLYVPRDFPSMESAMEFAETVRIQTNF